LFSFYKTEINIILRSIDQTSDLFLFRFSFWNYFLYVGRTPRTGKSFSYTEQRNTKNASIRTRTYESNVRTMKSTPPSDRAVTGISTDECYKRKFHLIKRDGTPVNKGRDMDCAFIFHWCQHSTVRSLRTTSYKTVLCYL